MGFEPATSIWGDREPARHHPVLSDFNVDTKTAMHTESSNQGLRAVLVELQDDMESDHLCEPNTLNESFAEVQARMREIC